MFCGDMTKHRKVGRRGMGVSRQQEEYERTGKSSKIDICTLLT
jgi:hypothetical protein